MNKERLREIVVDICEQNYRTHKIIDRNYDMINDLVEAIHNEQSNNLINA